MHTTPISSFNRLCCALGLGLSLTACGSGGDETSGNSTSATGTTGSTSPTSSSTGDTGSSSAPTTEVTTGSSGEGTSGSAGSTSTTEGTTGTTGDEGSSSGTSSGGVEQTMSFFVTSSSNMTGNFKGLAGADLRCQDLAEAAGVGDKTWHAYLSAEVGPDDKPVHAKDRIGTGPWYNANLVMVAADVADLHTKKGDPTVFVDEKGMKVNGQWAGSPMPNEHDILTGSNVDGTVAVGKTCADWTSEDEKLLAQVGHSDGLGPMMSDDEQYRSWNSVHENGGCNDTAPKGGAGKLYCFAID